MDTDWLKNLARLYLPVYKLESDTMKIAYAGYSSIKKNYYARFFDMNKHQTFIGWRLYRHVPNLFKTFNLDMVIAEIGPTVYQHFQKMNGYIVPEWASMRINIDRPLSKIYQQRETDFSDVKRKIRKYNLTYEMITDQISMNYFNDRFYLPFITKRHGAEAWIEDLSTIWKSTPAPLLIGIRENKEIVGVCLIRKSEESLYLLRLGLLDGNAEYRHHGVIGAIYYFSIIEAKNMGCHYMDIGGTRPFLTDGLTKFKIGLGAEFISKQSPTKEYLWFQINEHSVVAKEFFRRNPFMHVDKDYNLVKSGI